MSLSRSRGYPGTGFSATHGSGWVETFNVEKLLKNELEISYINHGITKIYKPMD